MANIRGVFTNSGRQYNFQIVGKTYTGQDVHGSITGTWDSSNVFGMSILTGNKTSILLFNTNGTITQAYFPSSTLSGTNTYTHIINDQNILRQNGTGQTGTGTWSGTLPSDYILNTSQEIDLNIQELYKAPGTDSLSFDQNYQATMMSGILVAMLGTSVLYYAFLNI